MTFDSRLFTLSARELDPLTWFTGPFVPLVFAAMNLLYGSVVSIITWNSSADPVLQFLGVALCSTACIVVHFLTRPRFPSIGWGVGALALTIAGAGFVLSAFGYSGSALAIEIWWAPFGLGLAIASLGPYLPARSILVLGFSCLVVVTPIAFAEINPRVPFWGPVSTGLIIISPVVSAILATATFSVVVAARLIPLIDRRSQVVVAALPDAEAERAERVRVAQLTARAAPFIEGVAASGVVSAHDRALAGQLARRLRDDLVTQTNLTWLESVTWGSRLVIIDPEHRANRMRSAQRAALRGLLQAIQDTPGTDAGSLLVELRGHPDGSTGVGVSLDMELPEGRRILHLRPYYLTLRATVDDLAWNEDRFLKVTFNLPDE